MPLIAKALAKLRAKSVTIDGEGVVGCLIKFRLISIISVASSVLAERTIPWTSSAGLHGAPGKQRPHCC